MITYGTHDDSIYIYNTQTYGNCNLFCGVETHAPCYDNSPPEIPPRDDGANPSDEATKATNINSDEMKRFIVLCRYGNSSSRGIPLCLVSKLQRHKILGGFL